MERSADTLSTVVVPGAGLARGGGNCSSCERLKALVIELQEQIDVQGKIIEGLVNNSPVTDMPVTDDGYGDVSSDVKKEQREGVDGGPTTYGVVEVAKPAPSAAPAAAAAAAATSSSSSSSSRNKSQVR